MHPDCDCDKNLNDYSLEAYINIIKNSPIGICITDKDGYFEYVNPKYCELYGYGKGDLIGNHFSLVAADKNEEKLTELHDKFIDGEVEIEAEWEVVDKEGNYMVVLANAAKIIGEDGEPKKVTYVVDLTDKKEMEWELQEKYSLLQESTEEIRAMNEELEEKQKEIKRKNKRLNENIAKAKKLHKNLLPHTLPQITGLDLDVYYEPAEQLGGDFYNLIEIDGYLLFYIVDITGHGIDGALLNVFVRETINSFLRSHFKDQLSTKKIIEFLAQQYHEEGFPDDYFLCIFCGVLNKKTRELSYSNAGLHIPPLISSAEKEVASLNNSSLPISSAFRVETMEVEEESFVLTKNDSLLVTTDGIIEEEQASETYGRDRLAYVFKQHSNSSAQEITQRIVSDFQNFTHQATSQDDITFLVMKNEALV